MSKIKLNPLHITIEMIEGEEFTGQIHIPKLIRFSDHIERLDGWVKCFECSRKTSIKEAPKKFRLINTKNIMSIYES